MNPFVIVLARDGRFVGEKIQELEGLNVPFKIVSGKDSDDARVVLRELEGKWDAINYGSQYLPSEVDTVVLNDVDTRICNFEHAFRHLSESADLVYCAVHVLEGPQVKFYKILDPLRRCLHITASGELMIMTREVFDQVMPIPPCIAEDTYILFKALELGYRAHFCTQTYVTTERTSTISDEVDYKARTTLGIYQALSHTKPPLLIRAFYALLPVAAPLLLLASKDGGAWAKGIGKAVRAHINGVYPTRF